MDTWVWYQVGLELGKIHIKGTIETKRSCDRTNNLSQQPVKIGVGGALDVQVTTADVVEGLVVTHEGAVRVLQSTMCAQDRVVWLYDGRGNLY